MKVQKQLYQAMVNRKEEGKKAFAVLIDPDDVSFESLMQLIRLSVESKVDYFLVGGSLLTENQLDTTIQTIKENCAIPIILFPGNSMHIDSRADGILFLSLISGRNSEYLIGQQVVAAPVLKRSGLEVLSTGYMLVDAGKATTVSYISATHPLPADKPSIAVATAMAGEMMGMKLIYMDAGSGAMHPISPKMISKVSRAIEVPLVVGGGINTIEKAQDAIRSGADIIVVGNKIEEDPQFLIEVANLVNDLNDA